VSQDHTPVASNRQQGQGFAFFRFYEEELATEKDLAAFASSKPYQLPVLADSILERGMSLIGTRYRFGGTSEAGFDCSGFIGYLFREEAGMNLPRSTREMINVDAPKVARNKLKPGDLLFFSTNGRGRVSHAGIYLGDNQFIHSSSRRSGGVRIDSLGDATGARPSSKPSAPRHGADHSDRAQRIKMMFCRGGVA
jgi:cell wall-associated NlpC family hydrolase